MTKKHVIVFSFLSLMFITGCANRESKTTNIDTANTWATIWNTELSGSETTKPLETATTCQQENTCFIIPADNTRTREFHIFDKNNLTNPLSIVKLPEDSSGHYISWWPYYAWSNAMFINDKEYVVW